MKKTKNFLTFTGPLDFIKTPSKTRFIIAAPQFFVKTLFGAVTLVLKLMYKPKETYNSKMNYFSRVNIILPV